MSTFVYASRGGVMLFGPLQIETQKFEGAADLDAQISIQRPVRIDTLHFPGPPPVIGAPPSFAALQQATDLKLPWALVLRREILWWGDPETEPRMAPLYRAYHQATKATDARHLIGGKGKSA